MQIEEAKSIKISDYLSSIGHSPVRCTGNRELFYLSPLRNEKNPSFNVNDRKNLWYDHGLGIGGSILELVMHLHHTDWRGALEILEGNTCQPLITNNLVMKNDPRLSADDAGNEGNLKIISNKIIEDTRLKEYLFKRQIPYRIAVFFLSEVRYRIISSDKTYYALAFKNDKGGYELRSRYFKGSTSPKYLSTVRGPDPEQINIFEGVFDFLTAACYFNSFPNNTSIILNSVSFAKKAVDIIAGYSKVNLYLDNDTAGKETVRFFQAHHPNAVDLSSHIYPDHKDFNEFWEQTSKKNYYSHFFRRGEICPVKAFYPDLPHHGLQLNGSNWDRHH
ncbi:MAG TPA: toprim domain-containing protein [Bacteroidales bacterium]|nr:toprim domain-containing protein [Bacteroidales bacterium]